MSNIVLNKYKKALQEKRLIQYYGKVSQVIGLTIESTGPLSNIGEICNIKTINGNTILAEVVGFKEEKVYLMPLGNMEGIGAGSKVIATGQTLRVNVGNELLGRVLDGLGNPIDGKGPIKFEKSIPINNVPPDPLERKRIREVMSLGIKAIDGLLTCGKGQRIGIFAGSGVGKSTLLGMMARNAKADLNVIALIGERGREVNEFLEKDLGEEGLKKSVVVVATSDTPALIRVKGAMTATAIAEYFRDQGLDVLLMMDSVTRFAMAQREVGLSIGEAPVSRGYTPSVFSVLPKLLERSGCSKKGSITALYTVLVDGDDLNEPIADAVRGILDGHIVLSRKLANKNHYPAIDVLASVSRVINDIITEEHKELIARFKDILATYTEAEDLINIGAYNFGSNPKIDEAIELNDKMNNFLRQRIDESYDFETTKQLLYESIKR
ncbi:MAG: Flagellar protein export ATPase FliI [Caldanaerobacter subterraneus]|jgi:flagellum-specific ATP synthase|uniref:Type 3 secretion system ATPase n=1 Tax=Thermoanaerobacter pseudethanolicus (strain ATCC 33223 / 39E) TaxID=340099 RepID=B0K9U5_THEP3|nr:MULTISPECIES: flagellar protein export ATPase FliI [Thermoanaerobacter]KUJ91466.1 MAG: flagellar protein export ATPase FliI [Thermoanaerobacter thermocopriae]KUK34976.1 MAG: Flagellar protein export ATPase FliI [Caldanaerobacter subterraneus]ABY92976.1 flagellar protein export ATPase FliI [Thermoanaerobacter sp. X514]ABY94908.1 flagellar protein export ATPase FliI [Thermoanaerobacter pseudethanolicus ATCC 33223]MDI3529116.1 flagellum-specific synthase [Thermoanaerobacter sp.]